MSASSQRFGTVEPALADTNAQTRASAAKPDAEADYINHVYEEMTRGFSEVEHDAMFAGNAARWYWGVLDRAKVRAPASA